MRRRWYDGEAQADGDARRKRDQERRRLRVDIAAIAEEHRESRRTTDADLARADDVGPELRRAPGLDGERAGQRDRGAAGIGHDDVPSPRWLGAEVEARRENRAVVAAGRRVRRDVGLPGSHELDRRPLREVAAVDQRDHGPGGAGDARPDAGDGESAAATRQLECADVAATGAVAVTGLEAVDAALVDRGAGVAAVSRRRRIAGVDGRAVGGQRVRLPRTAVVGERTQLRVLTDDVARGVADEDAVVRVLDEVVALGRQPRGAERVLREAVGRGARSRGVSRDDRVPYRDLRPFPRGEAPTA